MIITVICKTHGLILFHRLQCSQAKIEKDEQGTVMLRGSSERTILSFYCVAFHIHHVNRECGSSLSAEASVKLMQQLKHLSDKGLAGPPSGKLLLLHEVFNVQGAKSRSFASCGRQKAHKLHYASSRSRSLAITSTSSLLTIILTTDIISLSYHNRSLPLHCIAFCIVLLQKQEDHSVATVSSSFYKTLYHDLEMLLFNWQ